MAVGCIRWSPRNLRHYQPTASLPSTPCSARTSRWCRSLRVKGLAARRCPGRLPAKFGPGHAQTVCAYPIAVGFAQKCGMPGDRHMQAKHLP